MESHQVLKMTALAAVVLSAVALGSVWYQVDNYTVFNLTGLIDHFKPTYVFKLGNCDAYVYVARSFNDSTPMLAYGRLQLPPPKPAADIDFNKLLDALLKLPGGDLEIEVVIYDIVASDRLRVAVSASNRTELVRKVGERLGVAVYERVEEAKERLKEAAGRGESAKVAFITSATRRTGDVLVAVYRDGPSVRIWTTNLTEALKALRQMEGEVGKGIPAYITVGSYWNSEQIEETFRNAAMRWEEEMGTRRRVERGVEGLVHIFELSRPLGPVYLVFPYVNRTPPDEKTAKRLLERYVELTGFCPQPLIAEFWPKTGIDLLIGGHNYTAAATTAAIAISAAAVASAALKLRRRRR
ncbi:hypothetical protein [Pyrobaculum sp.]|uniref:hypothetical protein n=1 Tax=Pyrobaculum sp. TaxID=2004705 RepID=UPI003D1273C7